MAADVFGGANLGAGVLVSETGLGRLQVLTRTPTGSFVVDEPVAVGGLGSGPNPYDLLAAALGSCTAMTLRLYAQRKGWPLERVQVGVVHHRASLNARDLFERTIRLEGPLDDDQRQHLLDIADRCPVHLTFDRGSDVRTRLSAREAAPEAATGAGEHMRDMEEATA
jgi:putative redox protein